MSQRISQLPVDIHQVKTDQEWISYLELMWSGMRKKDGLPTYTKSDFCESGHLNYVLVEDSEIKVAVYAKQSPKDEKTLYIHRWAETAKEIPLVTQVIRAVEEQAKKNQYQKLRLLISTLEEKTAFTHLGFQIGETHPNSTETEPLRWMVKLL